MKTKDLKISIVGLMAFALLLGIGISSSTPAQAQDRSGRDDQNRQGRDWDRYDNYGGSAELRRTALNAGYNEGVSEQNNARNNRRTNYQDSNSYRRATTGYTANLGNRELYRRYFREAFVKGYNSNGNNQDNYGRDNRDRNLNGNNNSDQTRRGRNWDRYGSFGGSNQLRQTALNAGYNEGIKQGRSDRSRNRSFDFRNQNAYQRATQDYNSSMGDRQLYQRYYREGFENGYTDGSNGG
jgi:hypothetical protein